MERAVTSAEVAEHLPLIKECARKFTGRFGAEWDDLIQEGMIASWLHMRDEMEEDLETCITRAMRNWVAELRRQVR